VVDPEDFGYMEELWRFDEGSSTWSIGSGEVKRRSPRHTTDRSIDVARTVDHDRLIVHYMFPHDGFPLADGEVQQPFDALKFGDASRSEVWDAYLDNLRLVLDEVELLLRNVDADTVAITADHGEAFGEYGFYRHVIGCPIPCIRRVPWIETTATDEGTYESKAPTSVAESDSVDVEDRLAQLGYL
jgi:hypothetical protein